MIENQATEKSKSVTVRTVPRKTKSTGEENTITAHSMDSFTRLWIFTPLEPGCCHVSERLGKGKGGCICCIREELA